MKSQRLKGRTVLARSAVAMLMTAIVLRPEVVSAQPTDPINFNDRAYVSPVNTDPVVQGQYRPSHKCDWNGVGLPSNYGGLTWTGFNALDLGEYLYSGGQQNTGRCFVNGRENGAPPNLYAITDAQEKTGYQQLAYNPDNSKNVVAVAGGNTASFSSTSLFELSSMRIGAGWGNVELLTVTGKRDGQTVWSESWPSNINAAFLGTGGWFSNFGTAGLVNEVHFSASFAQSGPNYDPYGTVAEQIGYGTANPLPYRTFFIDDLRFAPKKILPPPVVPDPPQPPIQVPEPGSYALMLAGLVALGIAARRKRA
jgi:hypothetical protein